MKLQATILSPVVVVPRSSVSKEVMIIELGKLSLSNNHHYHNKDDIQALFEHIDVKVSSMNIKTHLLQEDIDQPIELPLLQDVNTNVSLDRLLDLQYKQEFSQMKVE
jgi:hypothetical protein